MDRNSLLNDNEIALRTALQGFQSGLWTAMPGIVNSVNLTKMTVSVQPAIQGTIKDENGVIQSVNLPLLVDVPITFPAAGGFILTFPIAVGDEVLVVIASRCIDSWWQSGGIGRPMEARMNDLSDGFAIPGPRSQPHVVPSISTSDVQLRNQAGTTYLSITSDGKIKLVSSSEIDITGPLKIVGNVNVTGTIMATGEITAVTTPLHTHVHSGVTAGGGSSGPPVP